jgi:hypothetical protein
MSHLVTDTYWQAVEDYLDVGEQAFAEFFAAAKEASEIVKGPDDHSPEAEAARAKMRALAALAAGTDPTSPVAIAKAHFRKVQHCARAVALGADGSPRLEA